MESSFKASLACFVIAITVLNMACFNYEKHKAMDRFSNNKRQCYSILFILHFIMLFVIFMMMIFVNLDKLLDDFDDYCKQYTIDFHAQTFEPVAETTSNVHLERVLLICISVQFFGSILSRIILRNRKDNNSVIQKNNSVHNLKTTYVKDKSIGENTEKQEENNTDIELAEITEDHSNDTNIPMAVNVG